MEEQWACELSLERMGEWALGQAHVPGAQGGGPQVERAGASTLEQICVRRVQGGAAKVHGPEPRVQDDALGEEWMYESMLEQVLA